MRIASLVILSVLVGGGARASACSVPVFRYALNYWPADPYELQSNGAKLPVDATINLNVREAEGDSKLLVGDRPVWSGVMTPQALARLLDSPARREIVARMIRGDSVVWVLVESGDAAKDAAALDVLTKRLKYLESIAIVPEMRPDDPANRIGPGPALAIRHSVLRVSRHDEREAFTLAMLEKDAPASNEPIVYPVFGRGRVLIALPPEKLTQDNIDEVAQFLTAACSCEVKDKRQGWDLLMQVDWDEELAKAEQRRLNPAEVPTAIPSEAKLMPVTPTPAPAELKPQTVLIEARVAAAPSAPAAPLLSERSGTHLLIAATMGIVLVAVGGLWLRKRA